MRFSAPRPELSFSLKRLERYPTFTQSGLANYPTSIAFRALSGKSTATDRALPGSIRAEMWFVVIRGPALLVAGEMKGQPGRKR
jgi:hypothetical protein